MDISYNIGKLTNHFNSNVPKGLIGLHTDLILKQYEEGKINIYKTDVKVFKMIIKKMKKFNDGYWEEENTEFKLLFYALIGLLKNNNIE